MRTLHYANSCFLRPLSSRDPEMVTPPSPIPVAFVLIQTATQNLFWAFLDCIHIDFRKSEGSEKELNHIWTWISADAFQPGHSGPSSDFIVFYVFQSATHNDNIESRDAEVHHSADICCLIRTWHVIFLEGETMALHFSCFCAGKPHHQHAYSSYWHLCHYYSNPRRVASIGWLCLDTKVRPQHLQMTVGTDLIQETNCRFVCSDEMQKIIINVPQGEEEQGERRLLEETQVSPCFRHKNETQVREARRQVSMDAFAC